MKMQKENILVDSFGRIAKKLRISVTDRCNFTCIFCMPAQPVWIPKVGILLPNPPPTSIAITLIYALAY